MSLTTPERIRLLQRKLYSKAKQDPRVPLLSAVRQGVPRRHLAHAYALARANGGAPGVDGVTFKDVEEYGRKGWLEELGKELREKTYEPNPVRRVMIPKPGGGERPRCATAPVLDSTEPSVAAADMLASLDLPRFGLLSVLFSTPASASVAVDPNLQASPQPRDERS